MTTLVHMTVPAANYLSLLSLLLLLLLLLPTTYIQLQTAVGANLTKTSLVHAFASLLKDPEAEVRASACNRLKGTSQVVYNALCHTFQGVSHTYDLKELSTE